MHEIDARQLGIDAALEAITSPSGHGVYASGDTLFKGAVFGRDSLEVAEDLLDVRPQLAGRILLTLVGLQGLSPSDVNEEERGKVIHEYRTALIDGRPLDETSQKIFDRLAREWGGNDEALAYYGSIDATPHFIRVLGSYCERFGEDFLDETAESRNKSPLTVREALHASADWLVDKLESSQSGMLEYQRRNPAGIANQVWKDSVEFYVHQNGELVNHSKPVASIEVQGLAYDALKVAANLVPERANEFRALADKLQSTVLDTLWLPESRYFALGVDHGIDNAPRCILTKTANPGALLDTTFFDSLPDEDRKLYVESIIQTLLDGDFLTDAGIRSRALSQAHVADIWDYHGSFATWPKETYDIAKGMRRQGFDELAKQLENRLLNACHRANGFPEFFYVDGRGRVLFRRIDNPSDTFTINVTNDPESPQAWTVSALMAIMADRAHGAIEEFSPTPEQTEFEASMLLTMPLLDELKTPESLENHYPAYSYKRRDPQSHDAGNKLAS